MTKSALTTCTPDRQDCLPAGPPARLWPMDGPTIDEFMALSEPQKDALVASWPLDLCEASAGMSSVQNGHRPRRNRILFMRAEHAQTIQVVGDAPAGLLFHPRHAEDGTDRFGFRHSDRADRFLR
jgi:hypothetical protein